MRSHKNHGRVNTSPLRNLYAVQNMPPGKLARHQSLNRREIAVNSIAKVGTTEMAEIDG